jgi:hypothetical protein
LDTWSGFDGAPYMHCVHFSFGLGSFIAPIIAEKFLKYIFISFILTFLILIQIYNANNKKNITVFKVEFKGVFLLYTC